MRIAQLPSEGVQYDMPWPIRKVPLKRMVRYVKYHPTSQTYVTVTSVPDPFVVKDENNVAVHDGQTPAPGAGANAPPASAHATDANSTAPTAPDLTSQVPNGTTSTDAQGHAKLKSIAPGLFRPSSERQTLELVSPVTWETVDRYELQEYEIVTSIETVSLESTQDASGRKKFIAVGTSFIKGDDSTMRGTVRCLTFATLKGMHVALHSGHSSSHALLHYPRYTSLISLTLCQSRTTHKQIIS